jgi:hypothetical protein
MMALHACRPWEWAAGSGRSCEICGVYIG